MELARITRPATVVVAGALATLACTVVSHGSLPDANATSSCVFAESWCRDSGGSLRISTTYNEPPAGGKAATIQNHLNSLIDSTPDSGAIRGAQFSMGGSVGNSLLSRLKARQASGVSTRLVLDPDYARQADIGVAAQELNATPNNPNPGVPVCTASSPANACTSAWNNLHSKFFLFSKVEDANNRVWYNVVFVTSWNTIAAKSGNSGYNSAITIYGETPSANKRLYEYLRTDIWKPLHHGKKTIPTSPSVEDSDVGWIRAIPSPSSTDRILKVLKRFDERNQQPTPGCQIQVMHTQFTSGRIEIAKRLRSLAAKGCTIRVTVQNKGDADYFTSDIEEVLDHERIAVKQVANIHDKSIFIRSRPKGAGADPKYITFEGSQNLNYGGLASPDLSIQVNNQDLYFRGVSHFDNVWTTH